MRTIVGPFWRGVAGLALGLASLGGRAWEQTPAADAAAQHHQRGVDHHNRRSLDEASREYARALAINPPRDATPDELAVVHRFAPRVYTTPSEFFPLKDVCVIMHPTSRVIAYHLFWEDDIDFPEDNDPCDHELLWVQPSSDMRSIERIWTYFHGHILEGGPAALADARAHDMRPRVNVQWGKHGTMPVGWEEMKVSASPGSPGTNDTQGKPSISLTQYNQATFRTLTTDGRRLRAHPIGSRLGWPERFTGNWEDFIRFSHTIDLRPLLARAGIVKVSRWNSGTINQQILPYNFRPKTEWPLRAAEERSLGK
jgi:hypothetical protein